jgi:hypothetical protein
MRVLWTKAGKVNLFQQFPNPPRLFSLVDPQPKPTFSATVRCGNSAKSWNISPTDRASGGT